MNAWAVWLDKSGTQARVYPKNSSAPSVYYALYVFGNICFRLHIWRDTLPKLEKSRICLGAALFQVIDVFFAGFAGKTNSPTDIMRFLGVLRPELRPHK
jgi:hypothetical protein